MTRFLLAGALLVLFVLAWQGVASLDSVDDLTLASPVETWEALREDRSLLIDNAGVTLVREMLGRAPLGEDEPLLRARFLQYLRQT